MDSRLDNPLQYELWVRIFGFGLTVLGILMLVLVAALMVRDRRRG